MANLPAELKRSFLQSIYDAVVGGTANADFVTGTPSDDNVIASLEDGLKAFQRMGFSSLKTGRLSLGSSGLSHEVKWAAPQQWRAFSQEEVGSLAQELREVYNEAVETLGSGTDLAILNTMMASDRMQSISSIQHDYTMLRWGNRF